MNSDLLDATIEQRLTEAASTIAALNNRLERLEDQSREPVAIVGMGLRLPGGVVDRTSLWQMLDAGTDATSEFPAARGAVDEYFDADPEAPGAAYCVRGGFLRDDIDTFDPAAFRITPREAVGMDPQQRLALELAWESLEDSGRAPDGLEGSSTGVWMGASTTDYVRMRQAGGARADIDAYQLMGEPSFIAGRISFTLGLNGPSSVVDTACSSSLVALHEACTSLREGEVDLALAGGVNLLLMPYGFVLMSKFRALAPDGRCKPFDAAANGYARGEGGVVFTLRRLSDAQADGDRILAVIRGSAVNHDGRSSGISVPNPAAQEAVIRAALADARIDPAVIQYVEAHGTGTALGDPIELRALDKVLGSSTQRSSRLLVGSIKSNIGHLEPAAGAAGLAKLVASFAAEKLPKTVHFKNPNLNADWERMAIDVVTRTTPWPSSQTAVAGISSFGVTGTNAHAIVEAPPAAQPRQRADAAPSLPLVISAHTPDALQAAARDWADVMLRTDIRLDDLSWTSLTGRSRLQHGLTVHAPDAQQTADALHAWLDGRPTTAIATERQGFSAGGVGFLFTGQGSQYAGMGRELFQQEWMQESVGAVDRALTPLLGLSLEELFRGEAVDLNDTRWTQPALFAYEYAVADALRRLGVEPAVVIGHSVGEIAACAFSGVLSLEHAAELAVTRGRLMADLPRTSGMAAVKTDADSIRELLAGDPRVSVAAVNGPNDVVVAGDSAALKQVVEAAAARGLRAIPLPVSHGFHSPAMDPILNELEALTATLSFHEPEIPIATNLEAALRVPFSDPRYWSRHARHAVNFLAGIREAAGTASTFVEVGPQPTLSNLGRLCLEDDKTWLPVGTRTGDDTRGLLTALGALHAQGVGVDWSSLAPADVRPTDAPTYPWQRQRFWFRPAEPAQAAPTRSRPDATLGDRLPGPVPCWLQPAAAGTITLHEALRITERACQVLNIGNNKATRLHSVTLDGVPNLPAGHRRIAVSTGPDTVTVWSERAVDPQEQGPWTPEFTAVVPVSSDDAVADQLNEIVCARVENAVRSELDAHGALRLDDVVLTTGDISDLQIDPCGEGQVSLQAVDARESTIASVGSARASDVYPSSGAGSADQVFSVVWHARESRGDARTPTSVYVIGTRLPQDVHAELARRASLTDLTSLGFAEVLARLQAERCSSQSLVLLSTPSSSEVDAVAAEVLLAQLLRETEATIRVLTWGAQPGPAASSNWLTASTWGFGRTAALEFPETWGGLIDAVEQTPATALADELLALTDEDELVFDATGQAFVPRLTRRADAVPAKPTVIPQEGYVVVTGAYGGIGSLVCSWLARCGVSRLALISRSGADDPARAQQVHYLVSLGVEVVDLRLDVTDTDALRDALASLRDTDQITGVVHAAGVSGPQNIVDIDAAEYRRVWNTKVLGAKALHDATQHDPIELFLCFSSIAATWGSQHLASYSAANAALDALCDFRSGQGLPSTSIAWGPWDLPSELYGPDVMAFLISVGLFPLRSATCIHLLDRLASTGTNWVVADADWTRYVDVMEARRTRPLFAAMANNICVGGQRAATDAGAPADLARRDGEEGAAHRSRVDEFVRQVTAKVLGLDDAQLPAGDVYAAGVDSLMVMEIATAFSGALGTKVQAKDLFERSTVAEWTDLLFARVGDDRTPEVAAASSRYEDPAQLAALAVLPPDLATQVDSSRPKGVPRHVLLTGATGFVGAHILRHLLDASPEVTVTCVVRGTRGTDVRQATKRLYSTLRDRGLPVPSPDRCQVILGDLSQPDIGLSAQTWAQLEQSVDVILHNGANVNFVHTFDQLCPANVESTLCLLRHARAAGNIPVQVVSSYGVWGLPYDGKESVGEDDSLATAGRLVTGYTQTKWLADNLARQAREHGQLVSLLRPGRVVCDATGTDVMEGHFTTRVIRGCIEMECAPDLDFELEVTPVDYVARAIATLSLDPAATGLDYHLINHRRMHFRDMVAGLSDLGYPVETVPTAVWWERLTAPGHRTTSLDAVLPTVEELIVGGERAIDYDDSNARMLLDHRQVTCPPFDRDLLANLLAAMQRQSLIPPPSAIHI